MSLINGGLAQSPATTAKHTIFTALLVIAMVTLGVAIIYLWARSGQLFGTGNPFAIVSNAVK